MGTSIYDKYPKGFEFRGRQVLNIGCGTAQFKRPNVVNLDAYDICDPDIVHDLEKMPLPFKDNTFDLILANHVLEHIHKWWECFEDCARILKPNGIMEVNLPGDDSDTQLGYRDHVSLINRYSFYGIFNLKRPASNAWARENNVTAANKMEAMSYTHVADYKKLWIRFAPNWLKLFFIEHLRNVTTEQRIVFRKLTDVEYKRRDKVYDFDSGEII